MAKISETSNRCAAAIVRAWRRQNLESLSRKLNHAAAAGSMVCEDTGESERWELLTGIADEFRRLLDSGKVDEAATFVPLLENLARPAVQVAQRAAGACWN